MIIDAHGHYTTAPAELQAYRGAQVGMLMRFDQSPDPVPAGMIPPGYEKKVMHCELRVGETTLFASDGCAEGAKFAGFSLALTVPSASGASVCRIETSDVPSPDCTTKRPIALRSSPRSRGGSRG